ncbi:GNAT family N-acetyltransferase [Streptomyces sp. NPDC051963]|uniref:GNAT family N-acetyltransferase n=1 Tax=Streptomyces sp. NPDC051963 TaxID=3365678 RepID=UPI0037D1FBCD
MAMAEVHLRRLSRWQAEQQRETVADAYVMAYGSGGDGDQQDRRVFLRGFAADVQRAGFDMVVADSAGLVGCAYGYRLDRTGTEWSGFAGEQRPRTVEFTASSRVFALAEVMVLPAHRRRGIATLLVERLLSRPSTDLVVASVDRRLGTGPREMLRAWGWKELGGAEAAAVSDGTGGMEAWVRGPVR